MRGRSGRAAAIPFALILDALFGEPRDAVHPVVWIGRAAGLLQRHRPSHPVAALVYGALGTVSIVGGSAVAGLAVSRLLSHLPQSVALPIEGWLLKTTLSARGLVEAGSALEASLDLDDLGGAREAARALVSRDVSDLDEPLLIGAAVESLAENTSDSIVAPLFYYALGGLPGALAYRAANTLDAMIGYRGECEYLGKVAARLDDLLNLVPARLTSAILIVAGALAGGHLPTAIAVTRRDRARTASPNAGWPMSTMAGLLGVRLEKRDHYVLGSDLPQPDRSAIDHAAEIVKVATVLCVPVMVGIQRLVRRRP